MPIHLDCLPMAAWPFYVFERKGVKPATEPAGKSTLDPCQFSLNRHRTARPGRKGENTKRKNKDENMNLYWPRVKSRLDPFIAL